MNHRVTNLGVQRDTSIPSVRRPTCQAADRQRMFPEPGPTPGIAGGGRESRLVGVPYGGGSVRRLNSLLRAEVCDGSVRLRTLGIARWPPRTTRRLATVILSPLTSSWPRIGPAASPRRRDRRVDGDGVAIGVPANRGVGATSEPLTNEGLAVPVSRASYGRRAEASRPPPIR